MKNIGDFAMQIRYFETTVYAHDIRLHGKNWNEKNHYFYDRRNNIETVRRIVFLTGYQSSSS